MRAHGIKLPPPDTTGNGPIFDTRRIDTGSAAFRAAARACREKLRFARAPAG
jgi:hypothetical protein